MKPMPRLRVGIAALTSALLLAACASTVDGGGDAEEASAATGDTAECASVDLTEAPEEPTTIRIGHGVASEEPFWLMSARPDLLDHAGTWYEMDNQTYRATEDRFVGIQAGELDALTTAPPGLYPAVAQGIPIAAVAAIMNEGSEGFSTTFVVNNDSAIQEPADLEGSQIAIPDLNTLQHMAAQVGMADAGLDPEAAAEYVVLPFPAQGEAVITGQVDVAGLPEPFFTMTMLTGEVRPVFTVNDVMKQDFPLIMVAFDRAFIEANTGAVCAWLADFGTAMDWYKANVEDARTVLHEQEFVSLDLDAYLQTQDYDRPDGGAIDLAGLAAVQNRMLELGLLETGADPDDLVYPGVTALTDE